MSAWRILEWEGGPFDIRAADDELIATVELEEHAHLIAAAPEMAEVCEMAVALGAAHPDSERGQLVAAARAALATARGEA